MPLRTRVGLVIIASLAGGTAAAAGIGFSNRAEPQANGAIMTLLWLVFGACIASPLWAPAVIPARLPRVLRAARYLGAAGALGLLAVYGTIAIHNIDRAMSGRGADVAALALGLVLSAACALGIGLLLRRA